MKKLVSSAKIAVGAAQRLVNNSRVDTWSKYVKLYEYGIQVLGSSLSGRQETKA